MDGTRIAGSPLGWDGMGEERRGGQEEGRARGEDGIQSSDLGGGYTDVTEISEPRGTVRSCELERVSPDVIGVGVVMFR